MRKPKTQHIYFGRRVRSAGSDITSKGALNIVVIYLLGLRLGDRPRCLYSTLLLSRPFIRNLCALSVSDLDLVTLTFDVDY